MLRIVLMAVTMIPVFPAIATADGPSKGELNREVVAATLNNNEVVVADGLKVEENELRLTEIRILLRGEVKPGDVVVKLQPVPTVTLSRAKFLVTIVCKSNLIEGVDALDVRCKVLVSGKYHPLSGVTIDALEFDDIAIKQLPAWGPFLKKPLNNKLAAEMKSEKDAKWKKDLDKRVKDAIDGYLSGKR